MWIWTDFLLPYLVLDLNKYKTISIAIQYMKGSYGRVDMGAVMAAADPCCNSGSYLLSGLSEAYYQRCCSRSCKRLIRTKRDLAFGYVRSLFEYVKVYKKVDSGGEGRYHLTFFTYFLKYSER